MARDEPRSRTVLDIDFDSLVAKHLQEHCIPGMSIGIIYDGQMETKVNVSLEFWSRDEF
jgi:hypothetical protein